ncbi:MAG: plasmid stabilization protein [Bacteroidetes bacterium GWA2_31_9]|nr:MAG: plasmid stabilization protein [Bacteroidetes bacterium GWA2_31_9]
MTYFFHPEAEAEFIQAINYYEECSKGLGYNFSLEVYSAIERILAYPKAWQFIEVDIRRSLVSRFPFGVLYVVDNDKIIILAIMHLNREPSYWKQRI